MQTAWVRRKALPSVTANTTRVASPLRSREDQRSDIACRCAGEKKEPGTFVLLSFSLRYLFQTCLDTQAGRSEYREGAGGP